MSKPLTDAGIEEMLVWSKRSPLDLSIAPDVADEACESLQLVIADLQETRAAVKKAIADCPSCHRAGTDYRKRAWADCPTCAILRAVLPVEGGQ